MRFKAVSFLATAAVLVGGRAAAAEAPAAKKCVMYQAGDLKVQVVRNRAMLQGEVNGQPVRVLVYFTYEGGPVFDTARRPAPAPTSAPSGEPPPASPSQQASSPQSPTGS